MPKSVDDSVHSNVVSVAAVVAVLSGALWPIAVGLLLFHGHGGEPGWRALLVHPWAGVVGLSLTIAFFVSAWLLERNRWIGAIFPAAWYLYGMANSYLHTHVHFSNSAVILPIELGIMLLALRDLWPLRAVRTSAEH